jgi:hypothetical protein
MNLRVAVLVRTVLPVLAKNPNIDNYYCMKRVEPRFNPP